MRGAPASGGWERDHALIITSTYLISDVDWSELFERISLGEEVFAGSTNSYREMDFPTRKLYRAAIE